MGGHVGEGTRVKDFRGRGRVASEGVLMCGWM